MEDFVTIAASAAGSASKRVSALMRTGQGRVVRPPCLLKSACCCTMCYACSMAVAGCGTCSPAALTCRRLLYHCLI